MNLIPLLILLLIYYFHSTNGVNEPMSTCRIGRATSSADGPPDIPQGTCGFGKVASDLPTWYTNYFVASPDDETYNGYPFVNGPTAITGTGVGQACGECFELTGPLGSAVVMNNDVCDKACCDPCQGSLGGPRGGSDVPDFVISPVVYNIVCTSGTGQCPITFRKVSCDIGSKTISMYISDEGNPNPGYVRMRFYNQRVGIQKAEVKGIATGGTGGVWTNVPRKWTGNFEWSDLGDIGCPFEVRITSYTGQVITFPQSIQATDLTPLNKFNSGQQFNEPSAGYGNSSSTDCTWQGPSGDVYTNAFGGMKFVTWRDWGSYGCTPVYGDAGGFSGVGIKVGSIGNFGAMQIGYPHHFPSDNSFFTHLTFYAKSDSSTPYNGLRIFWTLLTGSSSGVNVGTVTNSWNQFSIPLASFNAASKFRVMQFQNNQGSPSPVLYIDEIKLVNLPTSSTTSIAPVTTQQRPATTSIAPVTTSVAPVTTSIAPVTTSIAAVTTSVAPVTTQQRPVTTSVAPVTTQQRPVTTSVAPATTQQRFATTSITITTSQSQSTTSPVSTTRRITSSVITTSVLTTSPVSTTRRITTSVLTTSPRPTSASVTTSIAPITTSEIGNINDVNDDNNNNGGKKSGLSGGAIGGIVGGIVLLLVVAGVIVIIVIRKKREDSYPRNSRTMSSAALNNSSSSSGYSSSEYTSDRSYGQKSDFYSVQPNRGQNPMYRSNSNSNGGDIPLEPVPQYRAPKDESIQVGMICQGQWSDGNYYRVKIHDYSEVLGYLVSYVDFGDDKVYLTPNRIKK